MEGKKKKKKKGKTSCNLGTKEDSGNLLSRTCDTIPKENSLHVEFCTCVHCNDILRRRCYVIIASVLHTSCPVLKESQILSQNYIISKYPCITKITENVG